MHDDGPQTTPDDDHAPGDLRRLANDGGLSRREFVAGAGTVGIGLIASEWLDPLSRAFNYPQISWLCEGSFRSDCLCKELISTARLGHGDRRAE